MTAVWKNKGFYWIIKGQKCLVTLKRFNCNRHCTSQNVHGQTSTQRTKENKQKTSHVNNNLKMFFWKCIKHWKFMQNSAATLASELAASSCRVTEWMPVVGWALVTRYFHVSRTKSCNSCRLITWKTRISGNLYLGAPLQWRKWAEISLMCGLLRTLHVPINNASFWNINEKEKLLIRVHLLMTWVSWGQHKCQPFNHCSSQHFCFEIRWWWTGWGGGGRGKGASSHEPWGPLEKRWMWTEKKAWAQTRLTAPVSSCQRPTDKGSWGKRGEKHLRLRVTVGEKMVRWPRGGQEVTAYTRSWLSFLLLPEDPQSRVMSRAQGEGHGSSLLFLHNKASPWDKGRGKERSQITTPLPL